MGCICSTPSTTDSPRNSRPRKEPCFRLFRITPLQLAAQTIEIHGRAVATISNGGGVTKFRKNQVIHEVLQSREMEVSEATKGRGLHGKLNKVVVAYCGGLDTSVIVPQRREIHGCDVVCFTADVGQALVDIAKEARADAVSHVCTGKGNVQVCFELPFFAPNPKLNVVDPWREWDVIGREYAIEYAKNHNVPVPVTKKSIYSMDRNLWHLSHEGDILEDLANNPKKDMYILTVDPEEAQDKPENIEIGIESCVPVSVNGKVLSPASLIAELNNIGGKHGVGQIDMVENRLDAFMEKITETTTDSVFVTGCRNLYSLYRQDISSFESSHIYDQADAAGFIWLYGLPNFQ